METITVTGTYITLGYFVGTTLLYTFLWVKGIHNLGVKVKWGRKYDELKALQMARERLIIEMLNYKKETGYSFKKEHVEEYNKLVQKEQLKMEQLEKLV